ncbi:MAG: thioredoxin-disulfide reductase [Chlamydiae bacterium RIFCSPHIGHO2_12_FULL_49_11]|nr:MAG: thioredoxin-disulfide reductase [Chlamydiae bacterium RIFCSPHIGHO2_12_FULL_49_11]
MLLSMQEETVVIIGSGPAAWTAAIYAARGALNPIVFVGFQKGGVRGGQLSTTTEVENFPGFPEGISGPELVENMEKQARRFGARVIEEDVIELIGPSPFTIKGTKTTLRAKAVILATGAYANVLDVKGHKEFWNRGVSACAVCDGAMPIFRGAPLLVVGGGDSAAEEATYLTKYASKVTLAVRKGEMRASEIMKRRVEENPKIEIFYFHELVEIQGSKAVERVVLKNSQNGEQKTLEVGGVFYAIGHTPNSDLVKNLLNLDSGGYVAVENYTAATKVAGLFVAGDVADRRYRQAITASGMGCMAAMDAEKWISH